MPESEWNQDDVLPYVLVRTAHLLEANFSAVIAVEGLTPRHFGILTQFARARSLTAAEIARALDVTPQSIGPQIDALEARGLLTRTPRPGRGRPNELRLTAGGEATLGRALRIAGAEQERLIAHMSDAERRTMLGQLREIARRARAGRDPR